MINDLLIVVLLIFTSSTYYYHARNILLGWRDNDGLFHLSCAKEINRKKGLPKLHDHFFPGENVPYTYPPMLHYLLSLFVDRLPERLLLLWSIITTFLLALTVFLVCRLLSYSNEASLISALVFLIIPSNIKGAISITPRQLGLFFFFLTFVFAQIAINSGSFLFFCLSTTCLTGILLTHRMGAQLALICSITYLFFNVINNLLIVLWVTTGWLTAFLLAIVLSKGQYFSVFRDHLARLKFHFLHGPQTGDKKQLGSLLDIVTQNPFSIYIFVIIAKSGFSIIMQNHLFWTTAACTILVSILWIWGSGSRHIIFLGPFTPILLLELGAYDNRLFFYLFCFFSIFLCIYFVRSQYGKNLLPSDNIKFYEQIKKESDSTIVAVIPQVSSPAFVYFTGKRIFAHPHDAGAMEFNRLSFRYRLSDMAYITKLISDNHVDALLVDKNFNTSALVRALNFKLRLENIKWKYYEKND